MLLTSIQSTYLSTTTEYNVTVRSQHFGSTFITWPPSVMEDFLGFFGPPWRKEVEATFLSTRSDPVTHSLRLHNSGV